MSRINKKKSRRQTLIEFEVPVRLELNVTVHARNASEAQDKAESHTWDRVYGLEETRIEAVDAFSPSEVEED